MITAHQLAKKLLTFPDLPVEGVMVGQGGNESGNEFLSHVFMAGEEPEEFKKNNWGARDGAIGLYFNY